MPSALRIGVDLDGVVADFVSGWVQRYNAEFGARLRICDAVDWGAAAQLTHFSSMGEFWRWARHAGPDGRSLFRDLPRYPGAVEGLRELLRLAHVVVLTSKPQWAVADTLAWLGDLDLPLREVHMTTEKATVDCGVYVEDSPLHLAALRKHRPDAVVCRWVQPWNSPIPGCLDIDSWEDLHVVVRELTGRRG
ncbi:MAG: 5' nucleotidase, NT5C type [Pseudonocardiaceae bacterium]